MTLEFSFPNANIHDMQEYTGSIKEQQPDQSYKKM